MLSTRILLGLGVIAIGTTALAAPPRGSAPSTGSAPPENLPAPSIVKRVPNLGAITIPNKSYIGGPIVFDVAIGNPNPAEEDVKIAFGGAGTGLFSKDLTLKASSTTHETFTDPNGLQAICTPKDYGAELFTKAAVQIHQKVRVTPTCTFSTQVNDDWSTKGPDHLDALQNGNMYLDGLQAVGQPSCGTTLKFATTLVNHSTKDAHDVRVELFDGTKTVGSSGPLAVARGKSKAVAFDLPTAVQGKLWVKLVDSKNSTGGMYFSPSMSVMVKPTCLLTASAIP